MVILPAPYEHTSSYGKGSKDGPEAIINASHFVEFYDEEINDEPFRKHGIHTLTPLDFKHRVDRKAVDLIKSHCAEHIDADKFLVMLGAEHTCTLGAFEAFDERIDNLSVLQLDAHSDLREQYESNPYSHASVMARINERGPKIAQLGIRALCSEEASLIASSPRIETVFAYELSTRTNWQQEIADHLTENVYVTIDADGFDPSIIPGTGTPEPGGLQWYETLTFLKHIFTTKNVVGFDIAECSPRPDEIISEFTLAKLLYKLVGYRYLNQNLKF